MTKLSHPSLMDVRNTIHRQLSRDLKFRGRRRRRKRRWKSEFAFFQSWSRLLQVTNFVKCRRTLLKLNSLEPYSSSEKERKFRRRLCTSSVHREIRHFHVVVVQDGKEMHKKAWCTCKIVALLIKLVAFPLPSPSSDLKVPSKIRGRRRQRKRRWKSEFVFFQSSSLLLQVTNFFNCRRTFLKLNSQEP